MSSIIIPNFIEHSQIYLEFYSEFYDYNRKKHLVEKKIHEMKQKKLKDSFVSNRQMDCLLFFDLFPFIGTDIEAIDLIYCIKFTSTYIHCFKSVIVCNVTICLLFTRKILTHTQ